MCEYLCLLFCLYSLVVSFIMFKFHIAYDELVDPRLFKWSSKLSRNFATFYFVLNVVILLQIWVQVLINTDDSNSDPNWMNMNIRLRWGRMKLYRQYVSSLHLVVISQVSNWVSCDEQSKLAKVWSLVLFLGWCFVWWATVNNAWYYLEYATLVQSTKWC